MDSKPKDSASSQLGLQVVRASAIEPKKVSWLWPGRVPFGKVTLDVGQPGLGKSFALLDTIARFSQSSIWPDGKRGPVDGGESLLFSAEDDADDTIVPRLIRLGADLKRIHLATMVGEASDDGTEVTERTFSLTHDLPKLKQYLTEHPDIRLVGIDPISCYMGATDSHKNAEVRSAVLTPLASLAANHHVAVRCVTHFNKATSNSGSALDRISGSIAFPAAARAVWAFVRDHDDPSRRLMLWAKSNCGPETAGLGFRIVPHPVDPDNEQPTLEWIDGTINESLDDYQRRERDVGGRPSIDRAEAEQFLREYLGDGQLHLSTDVIETAQEREGISYPTLRRAGKKIGVIIKKTPGVFDGKWTWRLACATETSSPDPTLN